MNKALERARERKIMADKIRLGVKFDTNYEKGCVATEAPREWGNFNGLDSNGVEVEYNISMVVKIYD